MKKLRVSLLILAMVVCFGLSGFAQALEPPADATDDSGNPIATMKTLDEIPPTWSRILPADERFELVLNDEAVLDKETGLVWERRPDPTPRLWLNAVTFAYQREVGGRKGWRLPTIEELASLVDSTQNPALPAGHPFIIDPWDDYWSSTTGAANPDHVWAMFVGGGVVFENTLGNPCYIWCVRGGYGHDAR